MTDAPDERVTVANFDKVFASTLTPENRAALRALGDNADMADVWEIVLRNYVRVSEPKMFVRLADKKLIGDGSFGELHSPIVNNIRPGSGEVRMAKKYEDSAGVVKYAIADMRLPRAGTAVYEPGLGDWLADGTKFNMYRPPGFEPLAERPEIFLAHLRYLISDKWERSLVIAFLKQMVQNPEEKMQFALLIIGKKGTGKSWLSKFLEALFGAHNVYVLEKGERITSNFNRLEENRQAIFIDELCPGGKADLIGAIEPRIVGKSVIIEPKGVDPFTVPNRYNVIAISNYETALKIKSSDDRKWLVVRSTSKLWGADLDSPQLEYKEYFDRLHAVTKVGDTPADVTDEIRRALWWLRNIPIVKDWEPIDPALVDVDGGEIMLSPFNPAKAPATPTKEDVAALSQTTIESTLQGAFSEGAGPFRFELFTVEDARLAFVATETAFNPSENRSRNMIDGEISSALDDLECERLNSAKQVNLTPGKPRRLWVRSGDLMAKYEAMPNSKLVEAYLAMRKGKKPDPSASKQARAEQARADFED
jgi:hypothetical protein